MRDKYIYIHGRPFIRDTNYIIIISRRPYIHPSGKKELMIIEENEKNRIKKLHRNQFVLKEGMFVSPQGELMDDDMESIKIGDEVKVLVWELVQDMAFPGHYGTVSVIGTHERNGKPKGVVIDEVLQDDDESMLYRQGYLNWDDNKEMWDFYPLSES